MAEFDFGGLLGNLGSAFSGGGPGALDEYLTPEQRAAMQRNAMLQASAALLKAGGRSTTRTSLGQALGQALEAGQGGYEKGQTNAMQQILLKQKMDEAKQAAGLRQAISGIFNQPAPGQEVTPEQALAAPGMAPGPTVERAAMIGQPAPAGDTKVAKAAQYLKLADIYAASGKSEDAARFQKMADDLNPPEQVQGAPFQLTDQSGKPIMVQQMKNGKIMSLVGFGPPREIEMQNVGGKIVAVDKSQMVAGQGLDITMNPYQAAQLDIELKRLGMSREELDNKIKMDAARLGISQQELGIAIKRLGLSQAEFARGNYEVKDTPDGYAYVAKAPGMPPIPILTAAGAPLEGAGSKPTEDQSKSAGFAFRMKQSTKIFNQPALNKDGTAILDPNTNKPVTLEELYGKPGRYQAIMRAVPTAGLTTGVANISEDPGRQMYRQAQENWVSANLRPESGAVLGTDEIEKEIQKYFPQTNDKQETIDQKARARRDTELAVTVRAGPAYKQIEKQYAAQPTGVARLVKDPITGVYRYVME